MTLPAEAARDRACDAFFDLAISYATGTSGKPVDAVAAHKWFNLAGLCGSEAAPAARSELAATMTAGEIAAAQREARAWLAAGARWSRASH
jgi:TPR repeat protein